MKQRKGVFSSFSIGIDFWVNKDDGPSLVRGAIAAENCKIEGFEEVEGVINIFGVFATMVNGEIGNRADGTDIADGVLIDNDGSIANGTDNKAVVIRFEGAKGFEDVVLISNAILLNDVIPYKESPSYMPLHSA